jgi:2-phospho-L-lactate guanylyltransferase
MCPHALIPFKPRNPKTRLSGILTQEEREEFARAMLNDVIAAVNQASCIPVVVATELYDSDDVQITIRDKDLNETLNALLPEAAGPILIVMADLPLATPDALRRVYESKADVVLVPGRGGGTNVIFVREPARFHVDYYGASFAKHKKIAEDAGLSCDVVDSFRLSTDIDEEEDLADLLIHGSGKSREFLETAGFTLVWDAGRVGIRRKD